MVFWIDFIVGFIRLFFQVWNVKLFVNFPGESILKSRNNPSNKNAPTIHKVGPEPIVSNGVTWGPK